MTAAQLIELSVLENRAVTEYPSTEQDFVDLCQSLLTECDDDCDPEEQSGSGYSGPESRGLIRFWGRAENGNIWTVEIVNPEGPNEPPTA